MADLRDFTKKNTVFVGTDGIRLPSGNNAQRVASANVDATLRYNTDIGGMEVYSPNGWTPLAAPPSISTVSPSTFSGESGTSFEIQGTNINPDAQVYFVTSNGATLLAATITYFGSSQIRATTPRNISVAEEPLSVRLVQQSGTVTKLNCIDAGGHPDWVTTAGTLGSIFGANTVNVYVTATDPEGTAVSYQLTTGSLPGGLSFTTSNGLIQGVASSVLANTTYNFTIKASDTVNNNTNRTFSYTVLNRPPVINTSAGSLGTVYSGNATSASISAYDPDGGSLTYAVASGTLPANSSLGTANGVIQGTPIVVTTNTTYTFSISATDEGSLTASNTYTYTVLNRPPLWNTAATLSTINGADPYTPITVNAYDPDGGSVTYSLTSGSVPSGLTFVSANATITGLPDEVFSNTTSTFTVTATDVGSDANARTFSLTVTPIIDSQFSNTVLLLKTAGNTVIKDASSNNLPISVTGDARASNFNPFGNSWSNYFDGTDDNLYVSSKSSIDWMISSGNSGTIEAWIYVTSYRAAASAYHHPSILGLGETYLNFGVRDGGTLRFYWYQGAETFLDSSTTIPLNTWTHVAAVVNGGGSNNLKLYINGVNSGTGTFSNITWGAGSGGNDLRVGSEGGATSSKWLGYISNLRVSNNAVYTTNFSPSTTPLTTTASTTLLTCHKNRFVDETGTYTFTRNGDTKVSTWSPFPFSEADTTNGSMYFDGTGDYLTMSNSVCNVGTLPFTIEGWFHTPGSGTGFLSLYGVSNGGGGSLKIAAYDSSDGAITFDITGSSKVKTSTSVRNLMNGGWTHIALVRESTATNGTKCYINGVQNGIGTVNDNFTGWSGLWYIGHNAELYSNAFNGYMSNFRMVLGTAVYPSAFTPPTTPLTAIANTSLLTLQNRQPHNNHGFQDSSNNRHLVTRSGNASQGTFTPFSADPGKWSNYFNGSSSIRTVANPNLALGTGDVTVEFWLNTNLNSDNGLFGTTNEAAWTSDSWSFKYSGSALTLYNGNGGGDLWSISTGTLHDSTWRHIAIVRNSGTWQVFVGGVSKGTTTTQGTRSLGSNSWRFAVGCIEPSNADLKTTGFISNFHLANTALYTSNFTPTTSPIVAGPNTKLLVCQNNLFKDNSTANSGSGWGITTAGTPFIQSFSPFAPNSAYTTANTGGSIYLDGTGDYLTIGSGTDINLSTSDFSMEYWYYCTALGSYSPGVFCKRTGGVATGWTMLTSGFVCLVGGTWYDSWSTPYWVGSTASSGFNNSTSLTNVGQWTHVLLTRQGTDARWFVNGKLLGYQSRSGAIDQLTGVPLAVGFGGATSEQPFTGYISGGRISLGSVPVDYQTSSTTTGTQIFVPPTSPPTLTSQNTRSNSVTTLLNFTDAAIIDYSGKNVIETVGDAKANNSTYKFTPGSMYFDGTTDYLKIRGDNIQAFRSGEYTVEFWGYPLSLSSGNSHVVGFNATNGFLILATNSKIAIHKYGVGDVVGYNTPPATSTWVHYAFVREGTGTNQTKIYLNGNLVATGTDTNDWSVTTNFGVGINLADGSSQPFSGNIQDLRITRDARYVANFTPSTRSFPNR
jgi:Concanavalin A-like lectin/glucanases superfamily/Putative Ig domain